MKSVHDKDCPSQDSPGGFHEWGILGTPSSAATWYVCRLCGVERFRGEGTFYRVPVVGDMGREASGEAGKRGGAARKSEG